MSRSFARWLVIAGFVALSALTACAEPFASDPTALPTPTKLEAMQRDISPFIGQGLPSGLLPGERKNGPPPGLYQGLPMSYDVKSLWQQFHDTREDKDSGGVMLFLYGEDSDRQKAYDVVTTSLGSGVASFGDVGEKAGITEPEPGFNGTEIVFIRCRAVVHVRMFGTYAAAAKAYAERLDSELTKLACP